jgi:hypothetical protein
MLPATPSLACSFVEHFSVFLSPSVNLALLCSQPCGIAGMSKREGLPTGMLGTRLLPLHERLIADGYPKGF